MIVINCVMVNSWGTRNLVLSSSGRYFSFWYRSTITCSTKRKQSNFKTNTNEQFYTRTKLGLLIYLIMYISVISKEREKKKNRKAILTGTLVGNFALMPATSSTLVAATKENIHLLAAACILPNATAILNTFTWKHLLHWNPQAISNIKLHSNQGWSSTTELGETFPAHFLKKPTGHSLA